MTAPAPPVGPDASQKHVDAVEVPVEVLGAGHPRSAAGAAGAAPDSPSGNVPPQGAATAKSGLGKSSAFKAMLSLAVAVAADALEVAFPPVWMLIDACTTVAFFLIWGLRWEIAVVLLPELVPGMNVFPTWTLLALYLGKKGAEQG